MKAQKTKPYWKMTTDELRQATHQYDQEFIPTTPLTPAMRMQLQEARAKAKRGRRPVGQGSKRVLITVERGLLEKADNFARREGVSRSELIAQALKTVIGRSA